MLSCLPMEMCVLFDDKLDGWSLDRISVLCLPDAGLHGVSTARQGPEELMGVPCCGADAVTIYQPINAYHRYIFG
jgi:hypothetical protein